MPPIHVSNIKVPELTGYKVIENEYITMSDGIKLSAKIWLPQCVSESVKVPAILEFLPYRKREMTSVRDNINYKYFAQNGYAGVRVDTRGTGDSYGDIQDEYAPQEHKDAVEVISWISTQTWCSGNVGMMGISWGGFNSLQVAYLQPPALKAIISVCATDDRYSDDIHFKGGAMLIDKLLWAAEMEYRYSLPPDPLITSDWKEVWLKRLETKPALMDLWFSHQTRDCHYKHGSICEDYSRIKAPTFLIGGYADGYTNTVMRTYDNLSCPRKALVGPWAHVYPNLADPEPRWNFLLDAVRWWDKWLKDEPRLESTEAGYDSSDSAVFFIQERVPLPFPAVVRGLWVKDVNVDDEVLSLSKNHTDDQTTQGKLGAALSTDQIVFSTPENCGTAMGAYFPRGINDMSKDQSEDDNLSYAFETDPFTQDIKYLGYPTVHVSIAADKPVANVYLRLCLVDEMGKSRLIAYTAHNLNHDDRHETVSDLIPGELRPYSIKLDFIGETVHAGCKLRLCFSTSMWPMFLPNPEKTTLTLDLSTSKLIMPKVTGFQELSPAEILVAEPVINETIEELEPANYNKTVTVDESGRTVIKINNVHAKRLYLKPNLITEETSIVEEKIHPDNPQSIEVASSFSAKWSREDWIASIYYEAIFKVNQHNLYITEHRQIEHNSEVLINQSYARCFPRNGI